MSWKFCTSGSAIAMAGTNANSTLKSYEEKTIMDGFSDYSEGTMELDTGMTLSGSFTTFATGVQHAIGDICASKIALKIIAYDTTGYLSREADALMNLNDDIVTKGIKRLKDHKNLTLNTP